MAGYDPSEFRTLERAFARSAWSPSADGFISPVPCLDLTTGGRDALDEQIARIRGGTDDPGQLLGSAKDLLEAVSKLVLEEFLVPVNKNADFGNLWHLARERLGILPAQIDKTLSASDSICAILQSSWTIAEQANTLRGKQGTGLRRTLPTGVSPELALLVVRKACSLAEYVLTTLDRSVGRTWPACYSVG